MNSCRFQPGAVLVAMVVSAMSVAFVAMLFCMALM